MPSSRYSVAQVRGQPGLWESMNAILPNRDALLAAVRSYRSAGRTIVTTNGSFDILHRGHLAILSVARRQGGVVIVGLNSDQSVRAYKGPLRPIIPQEARAALLAAMSTVDHVYLFDEPDCVEFVRLVQPDVHVNDASYGPDCIEAEAVARAGGRLVLVNKVPCMSTSDIIEKIVATR